MFLPWNEMFPYPMHSHSHHKSNDLSLFNYKQRQFIYNFIIPPVECALINQVMIDEQAYYFWKYLMFINTE